MTLLLAAIAAWGVTDIVLHQPMPLFALHMAFEVGFVGVDDGPHNGP
jgi:hypothetical protein